MQVAIISTKSSITTLKTINYYYDQVRSGSLKGAAMAVFSYLFTLAVPKGDEKLASPEQHLNAKEISQSIELPHKEVYKAIKELQKLGLLASKRMKSNLRKYFLNKGKKEIALDQSNGRVISDSKKRSKKKQSKINKTSPKNPPNAKKDHKAREVSVAIKNPPTQPAKEPERTQNDVREAKLSTQLMRENIEENLRPSRESKGVIPKTPPHMIWSNFSEEKKKAVAVAVIELKDTGEREYKAMTFVSCKKRATKEKILKRAGELLS